MRETCPARRGGEPPKNKRGAGIRWKPAAAAGLLGLAAALAAGNVALGILAVRIYGSYNALRRDPLGILRAEKTPAGPYDVLLMGDSLAERWKIEGCAAANLGISGQTSGQVLHRMQLMGEGIRARRAIICVGGNDLKTLRAEPELAGQVVEESLANLRASLRLAKGRAEKTCVVTVPPIGEVAWHWKAIPSTKAILGGIERLNAGIRELAEEEGVAAIDCERAFRGMAAEEIFAEDKAHLSEKAYEALEVEVRAALGGWTESPPAAVGAAGQQGPSGKKFED